VIELKQFIAEHPIFKEDSRPDFLSQHNRDDLKRAVYLYNGLGYLNEQYQLGLKVNHQTMSKEKLLVELQVLLDHGHAINQKVLRELDRNDLLVAAINHGGLNVIKQEMGLSIH
ncbi:MAG: hypothetical protein J7497_09865, partial [Chitinophagaceae bacterium]|nr:hypothetical protein [Chitinophagaceae bacterium]